MEKIKRLENLIEKNQGILPLKPAWVARDFLPPGRRLGLPEKMYELGERGGICERWIGSTTPADNRIKVPNEGLSMIDVDNGEEISLKEAVEWLPERIMGDEYSKKHAGLGRLPKIFDYAYRLPYHLHQMQKDAEKVGCKSKEEAYYFPEGVDLGAEPETYFGVHPYIADEKKYELLLPAMQSWYDESILQFSRAYRQLSGDGFHVPAGILHAPGSALTIELQEDSDVFAMLQAKVGGQIISKDLLYKDITPEDRDSLKEKAVLDMIDWKLNGDPYFYENRHTPPLPIENPENEKCEEYWIFYNTRKFSGKKLVIKPGGKIHTVENGVYNILVWQGKGSFGGYDIQAFDFDRDELLVCHNRAVDSVVVENTGNQDLIIFKFFGPDINPQVPMLKKYPKC
ncbi:TPA: hypothetical protein DCG86_07400 [Candidatus Marinimicrobia bacterium]|nr:MAG: hypothetical protein XD77_0011 [Marinimicrobia bacterium 46_47]HAE87834.1 hypothetical protein [Candidatus Neomarinimicrobiota bacterium]HBY18854.1 hypothetical protein [Candidatus Neomarinimicrobiota bacterium]